eukprot:8972189-Alexandrium_andersonii.AAC.1
MQDPPSDSDSEDEHPSEQSEEIMQFEKVIAEDTEQFGILGETEVLRALEADAAILGLAADNAAADQAAAS